MRKNQRRLFWLGISILGALTFSPALLGQASPDSRVAAPVITDWSHQHVVFSKPATAEQAKRLERDPRYRQQRLRHAPADNALAAEAGYSSKLAVFGDRHRIHGEDPAINEDWSLDLGSGASVGATNYPAKIAFRGTNAVCGGGATQPDFVVYATGLEGSATQPSIVAFDNLYSGCVSDGTVPTVYWSYDTQSGTVNTSPAISADANQIAFVQTDTSGNGVLVLLKWAASSGTLGNPVTLSRVRNSDYPTCTAPCMTSTLLTDGVGAQHPDSNSSVFYDFSDDTAYVGDDGGWLHQINPVFNGVPAEVRSAGWPVQVNPTTPTALTSPVFDYASGRVFVADVGGFLYRVGPNTAFTAVSSGPLDVSSAEGGAGIVQGPIVDSTDGLVYVFSSSDGSTACTGGAACAAVFQFGVDFNGDTFGSKVTVGSSTVSGSAPNPLYLGAFDSTYENSVNATGNLYVCGNTGGTPALFQVPITAGVFGASVPGPILADTTTPCSPVTDLLNPNASGGPTERVFVSVETEGISSACANGCIFNFTDTAWQASTAYTVGQEVLDSNLHVQVVVSTTGPSGTGVPAWNRNTGGSTTDGGVKWLDQGALSAPVLSGWASGHHYTVGTEIVDPNDNIELVTSTTGTGHSGSTIPTFNQTAGGTTTDGTLPNTVTWTNVGAIATADAAATGGTSGIIVDNTVGSGTLAGASQVYFSTLSDQPCGTSGTGGCAIQASQAALQ